MSLDPTSPLPRPWAARLLVLAKQPVPGRVKTRLTPDFSPEEAAALAAASLEDTCATVEAAAAHLDVRGVPVEPVLVLEGELPTRSGWRTTAQVAGGLDRRLAGAFAVGAGASPGEAVPTVLVGMDTPQVSAELLSYAVLALVDLERSPAADACFGPASDGGWWLLGLRRPDPSLLLGLPMSVATTGTATRRRLSDAGLSVVELPVLCDVDTPADADTVAADAPGTRFAAAFDALVRGRRVAS